MSTTASANDFDTVLREFQSIASLIVSMPADERDELRNRLDQTMNANDQLTALAQLMVSIAVLTCYRFPTSATPMIGKP